MEVITNIIGFLSTIIIILSMVPKNIKTIRILNLIGSIICIIYSIMTNAPWHGITNGILIIVNSYHLYLLMKGKEDVCKQPINIC